MDDEKDKRSKGGPRSAGPRGRAGSGDKAGPGDKTGRGGPRQHGKPGGGFGGPKREGGFKPRGPRPERDAASPAGAEGEARRGPRAGPRPAPRPGTGRDAAGGETKRPFRKHEPSRAPGGERPPHRKRDAEPGRPPRPGKYERSQAKEGSAQPRPETAGVPERIAKRLARAGVASRRDAEEMVAAGRVSVNGRVLDTPALNVGAGDRIEVDGKPIPAIERTRLFLFYKPAGVVTTSRDPEGRKTVFELLPESLPRLVTIGRLDINTEGLLLLTNDGGLARILELPATGWLRRYRVRVHGKVDQAALDALKDGVAVDGVFYGGVEATLDREQGSNAWLTVGLREGKNREVKNIMASLGLDVTRLIRLSYGPFQLGELREGEIRELKGKLLRDQLGERLIAESGANFDAPVLNEFTNKPAAREADDRVGKKAGAAKAPTNKKKQREQKREDALGRLDTRPKQGGKPHARGGKPDARGAKPEGRGGKFEPRGGKGEARNEERRDPYQPRRSANVWMAPGARPLSEKQLAERAELTEGRRYAGKPRPQGSARPAGGDAGPARGPRRDEDKPRGPRRDEDKARGPRRDGDKPRGPRPGGPGKPRRGGPA